MKVVKRWWLLAVVACTAVACRDHGEDGEVASPTIAIAAPPVAPPKPPKPAPPPPPAKPTSWTFVALSDLHIPNNAEATATVKGLIAAVVEMKPRAVVITGDFTNGAASGGVNPRWWPAVLAALEPLRAAKIPVLPVAGNHDSYGWAQKKAYHDAWGDLKEWTPGLELKSDKPTLGHDGKPEMSVARVPFSYSVDIDGVHFALTHIVTQHLEAPVAAWLKADLASARSAKARLVFGHVPLASVIRPPSKQFLRTFGPMLEEGLVDLSIYGHEHVVWDDKVQLRAMQLRQVLVGCSSGFYNFGPSREAMERAGCAPEKGKDATLRCKMPSTGGEFQLVLTKRKRMIQHYKNSFTLFTVDDGKITVTPMTIDAVGKPMPFYLAREK